MNQVSGTNTNGLVGYWDFDESLIGSVMDLSLFQHNGTMGGGIQDAMADPNSCPANN